MNGSSEVLQNLVAGISEIYGSSLKSVILYGSVARGTNTEESDIDIAVIVYKDTPVCHDRLIDLTVDLELEYDVVLSVLLIEYTVFKEWENVLPFYINVKKEGVLLWNAA